jgi:succinyl-CoA synthetase beta subunit
MNIHEYQAKALLHEFGVPISKGVPVLRPQDSDAAAKTLPGPIWVVKSQIHAGGRGKGKFKEASAGDKGGVRIAKSIAEVNEFAKQMLGATLVTVQTGEQGKQVSRLYIEDGSDIDKEFYLSILVDRETSEVSFVVSTEGGVNIEDVAHNTPEKIVTFSVDPATGIMGHHGRTVAKALKLSGDLAKQAEKLVAQLYGAFVAKDMAMLEINPLVVTKQGQLRVLDAKVSFDDNALFRHPEVAALRDETEEDARRSKRRNTTSTTSRWTAISAAWSTAPALRWRRWTSSSSTACRRRTSSMSAAAPASKRWPRPSRSSPPIPM